MFPLLLATVLISVPLVPPQVKDAQSLYEWERANMSYQNEADGIDDWKEPERTLKDKGGDCEDFSLFNEKVLKQLGYKAKAIAIYGEQENVDVAHAICVVEVDGKWRYFSNQYYSYFKDFDTIQDIVKFEFPIWEKWGEISLPNKIKNLHYQVTSGN